MGKTHLYIAASLDCFIATEDGGVAWLDTFQSPDSGYGYEAFLATVDTLVMGRVTYEQVRGFGAWPYAGKHCIVLSQGQPESPLPEGLVFRNTLPSELAGTIWLVGGRQTVQSYLAAGLIDRIELFIMPVLLGTGIPLFTGGTRPSNATLTGHTVYPNGVVRLVYDLKC